MANELKPKRWSKGVKGDSEDYELFSEGELELAKRDASAENRGLGSLLAKGVGAVMASLAGSYATAHEYEPTEVKHKEVQQEQPRASKRQKEVQVDAHAQTLDEALKRVDELHKEKSKLTLRVSKMDKDIENKRQEIIELQTQLKLPEVEQVLQLKGELDEKDSLIAEKQARIEQLLDQTTDTSLMLATSLGEKEAELAGKNKALVLEKARLRACKDTLTETRKEVERYRKKCLDLEKTEAPKESVDERDHSTLPTDDQIRETTSGDEPFTVLEGEGSVESAIEKKVRDLEQKLHEKEQVLTNVKKRLKETEAANLALEQAKDHSKSQSRILFKVRQELDATKMSHDELVQYIGSLEHQIEDTERHSQGLESVIENLKQDKEVLEQALKDTKESHGAELKEVKDGYAQLVTTNSALNNQLIQINDKLENLSAENETFKQERELLKKEILVIQEDLVLAKTEAGLYKEDFDNERKDREKAHDLKEEMRLACDQKVHAMTKQLETERTASQETIQKLTRRLEGASDEHEMQEMRASRSSTRHHQLHSQLQLKVEELQHLNDELFEVRQKAITAQEEVQAKTAQVKQYKKKDDQREEKLAKLEQTKQELSQEMERVRQELVKTKEESRKLIESEKKEHGQEMNKVRHELEKALRKLEKAKKMTKGEAQEELIKLQEEIESLREDNEKLNKTVVQVEEQFTRLRKTHLALKQQNRNSSASVTSPTVESSRELAASQAQTASVNTDQPTRVSEKPTGIAPPTGNEECTTGGTGMVSQQPLANVPQNNFDNVQDPPRGSAQPPYIEDQQPNAYNQQPKARVLDELPCQYEHPRNNYPSLQEGMLSNRMLPNDQYRPRVNSDGGSYTQSVTQMSANNQGQVPPGPSHPPNAHGYPKQFNQPETGQPYSTPLSFRDETVSEEVASPTLSGDMQLVVGDRGFHQPRSAPPSSVYRDGASNQQQFYRDNEFRGQPQHQHNRGQAGYDNSPRDYNYQHGQPQDQQLLQQQHWQQQQLLQQNQMAEQQYGQPWGNQQQPQNVPRQPHNQQQVPSWQDQQQPQYQQPYQPQWEGQPQQPVQWNPDQLPQQPQHQYHRTSEFPQHYPQEPQYVNRDALADQQHPPIPKPRKVAVSAHEGDQGYQQPVPNYSQQPSQPVESQQPNLPQAPSPVAEYNPNDTRLLIQHDNLQENIDEEMSEAVAEVTATTTEEGERKEAPLDPNLVCPMCMKQYRLGEIQLFRAHVGKCDGTR